MSSIALFYIGLPIFMNTTTVEVIIVFVCALLLLHCLTNVFAPEVEHSIGYPLVLNGVKILKLLFLEFYPNQAITN